MRRKVTTVAAAACAAALLVLVSVPSLGQPPEGKKKKGKAKGDAPAAASADLALVPADAAGFVHVRLADLWKNDMFAGLRKTWERAGEKAIRTVDKQFVPAPSSLDRVTAFVLLNDKDPKQEPHVFGLIAFSAPFDPAQVAKLYLPEATTHKVGGKTVYGSPRHPELAVHFPDNRHILISTGDGMLAYLSKPVARDGPMASALKLAATRPMLAAVNIAALPIPPDALNEVPEEVRPILKAEQLVISMDLGATAKVEVKAAYKDAAAAQDAEKAVRALIDLGRKELAKAVKELEGKLYDPKIETPRPPDELPEAIGAVFGLGALGRIDDLLADPNLIQRSGRDLTFTMSMPKEVAAIVGGYGAIGIGLLLPAVQKVRNASERMKSSNNLKQIGLAMHNYHDTHGHLPPPAITDKAGKPLLSWRVAILPYIEQDALYRQFKLDEPWDSPHNKKLANTVVPVYTSPSAPPSPPGGPAMTYYKAVVGPGTAFEPGKKLRLTDFLDGTSNTVMVVEAGDPVIWTKPDDLTFNPKQPLPKLTPPPGSTPDIIQALLGDGSVRAINTKSVKEDTIKAAFTRNGGEVLGKDW